MCHCQPIKRRMSTASNLTNNTITTSMLCLLAYDALPMGVRYIMSCRRDNLIRFIDSASFWRASWYSKFYTSASILTSEARSQPYH